uniref:Uncharacterized protein LOC111106177 n=1 Tax=Crassostrea virginica TaxID=6565 RepID=A0A8B8B1F2_CRAVI|nr:uncharacterized protein LOC111106177 [Crassostrea virginica]
MYLCYFRKLTSNNCAVCFGYKRKSATVLPGVSRYKDMKQFNIKFWIIILLSAAESTAESTAESIGRCNESIPTVDYVASCPKTETEWINASQRKSCESLAELQTCTQAQKFKYHCVFNSWKNATLEVCAPEIISQGFCVNFNEAAAQLQLFYNEPCTEFLVPCKTRFKSSNLSECKYVTITQLSSLRSYTIKISQFFQFMGAAILIKSLPPCCVVSEQLREGSTDAYVSQPHYILAHCFINT